MSSANEKQPVAALKQEMTDDTGRRVQAKTELDFPSTALGNMARVYTVVGVVGFVVIGAMAAFFLVLKTSLDNQEANQLYMQQRLDRMWDDAARERREMVDRYLASRELTDKRHAETLTKLDKIVLFIERLVDWQRMGGAGPKNTENTLRPEAPKMLEKR